MIVKNYMAQHLITITPSTKINDAVELMTKHKIHRLPVLDQGNLVGLITEGTIQGALPSKATSLSVYEVNYLLNKTTVADVMIKDVQTIEAAALLEEGIYKMRQNNIGVLPVTGTEGELVGIITNNDIFDAFLEITGYQQDGVRVAIRIENDHQGVLADLTRIFADREMNIVQIVVYRNETIPTIVTQLSNTIETDVVAILAEKGYDVLFSTTTNSR